MRIDRNYGVSSSKDDDSRMLTKPRTLAGRGEFFSSTTQVNLWATGEIGLDVSIIGSFDVTSVSLCV